MSSRPPVPSGARDLPLAGAKAGLPLALEPAGAAELPAWLLEHRDWLHGRLREHGAVLLRGFPVTDVAAFEQVAGAVDADLKRDYLGTSPRNALSRYVFSASELPGFYPIPQHCEMSFLATPPRRVFFGCLVEPRPGGGETPLVDFRRVYADLAPEVRERFLAGGLRIIRNYCGPRGGGRFDLWKLKRWDEVFSTTDREQVERSCREQGFTPVWLDGGRLRLLSEHPIARRHPETGEWAWHNHAQVFHLSAAPAELQRVHGMRPSLRAWFFWQLARLLVARKRRGRRAEEQALHCTYRDGREIPAGDLAHLRDVIWRNLVVFPWRRGDVLAIDNYAVGHGRLPYRGPRQIVVAWA